VKTLWLKKNKQKKTLIKTCIIFRCVITLGYYNLVYNCVIRPRVGDGGACFNTRDTCYLWNHGARSCEVMFR